MKNWKRWVPPLAILLISVGVALFMLTIGASCGAAAFCVVASCLILTLIIPTGSWRRSSWHWEDPHG